MLNRTPTNTTNTINAYRKKRQQKGPFLMYGAIALVVIGLIVIIFWMTRPGEPLGQMFATDTPTATVTFTPTNTSTPTPTSTVTETPTITVTSTPSEPFPYVIQEGDSLSAIAEKFGLGKDGILLIYYINPDLVGKDIQAGQTIKIPIPGTILPTTTPIPANLGRGTKIEYTVLAGDTLAGIAVRFNSLPEEIMKTNDLKDANSLQVGQTLQIPVNLVTATATLPSTSTPVSPTVQGGQPPAAATTPAPASTSASGGTAGTTASCAYDENAQFVSQLEKLINDERAKSGLPALTVNAQVAAAAKAHAADMLCNNSLSHTGSDGSTPQDRVKKAGFTASLVLEELFALHPAYGGNPQAAIDWWMNNPTAKADLLNKDASVLGVAYVSSEKSMLGGYFVVVLAKP